MTVECSVCGEHVDREVAGGTPGGVFCPECVPCGEPDHAPTAAREVDSDDISDDRPEEIEPGVYPDGLAAWGAWVSWIYVDDRKQPFAPWGDREHPDGDPERERLRRKLRFGEYAQTGY